MSRYDQQPKNKKTTSVLALLLVLALVIVARFGWFYYQHRQNSTKVQPQTLILPLPSGFIDTAKINPQSITESIQGELTAQPIPETQSNNQIVSLPQDSAFILPDHEHSDALFRAELTAISPSLAEWLNSDQLIRKYVAIINDFSQGSLVEKHLSFIKLELPFSVEENNDSLFIAAKSYQRYERLATAVNALDVQASLAVYTKFRPLLLQVFNELGYPAEYNLEDILAKAAAVILAAPVIDGQVGLVKHALNYKFADQQLEALNPVQKLMLRMGPENTRVIQNKLRLLVEGLVNLKD